MRPLLLVLAVVVAATAHAAISAPRASGFEVEYFYEGRGCSGPNTSFTMPYDKCMSPGPHPKNNATGITFTRGADNATCATITLYDGNTSDCSGGSKNVLLDMSFPCGICQHDEDPTVGRFIWTCNREAAYVVRYVQCNHDCSQCAVKTPIGLSGCVPVGGLWGSLKVSSLFACDYVQAQEFTGGDNTTGMCAQAMPRFRPVCGMCLDNSTRYIC